MYGRGLQSRYPPTRRIQEISALAEHELPLLQPDFITLYTGCNNANLIQSRERATKAYQLKDWLYGNSLTWRTFHSSIKSLYLSWVAKTKLDPVELPHLSVPVELEAQRIEELRGTGR